MLIDVLANDTDPDNDLLSILSVATPATGTAVIEAGKIRYTPGTLAGLVSFAYTIVDELGLSATAGIRFLRTGLARLSRSFLFRWTFFRRALLRPACLHLLISFWRHCRLLL